MKPFFEDVAEYIGDVLLALLYVVGTIIVGLTFTALLALPILGAIALIKSIQW